MPQQRTKARRALFPLTPVAIVACALLHAGGARAQPADTPLQLKASPMLREDIPQPDRQGLPSFVSGDTLRGTPDLETVVEGNAQLRRGDTVIRADRLEYYAPDDLAKARGNVRINRAGNIFEGPELQLKVESFEGFFNQPRYRLLRNDAYGQADRVDFIDDKRSVIRNATYTTCQREDFPGWMPAWILRAASIRIDEEEETGHAQGAALSFMGVTLPVPSMSFPLTDKRKSGLLPPTIGVDNVSGVEVTVPYYWNIAPNRDATFYPTLMSKRGVDLGAEFRYLEPTYRGTFRGDFMPRDELRKRDRWAYAARHDGVFSTPAGGLGLHMDLNRVSDDNYWRDFSRTSASLTQRLLANEGSLSWSRGDFSISARALKWQTLQDVTAPITPPYDRMPQVVARYQREALPSGGFDMLVETDTTRFRSDQSFTLQPNAVRTYALARISRPWLAPGWFVIPKLQLHATRYEFDSPLLATGSSTATRTVPTFSLDSGLVFERDTRIFGRALRQTLEPRAFYVRTPYRNQNFLPNYDTARYDFSFATVYTENEFGGHDRIADQDLLTVGVGTRLLDAETGAQAARFDIAQRLRFRDQLVTLPGQAPATERLSDVLLGASVNWVPQWGTDVTLQYNPKSGRSERATVAGRYNPEPFHVVSAAYRVQREQPDQSEQLDIGWQWPISKLFGKRSTEREGGRWYSVGRLNMSLKDRRVVDGIVGFEYDACCWVGRIVLERLQSGTTSSNKRILFQIEFVGFTRVGSSALQTLRDNIPRYQFLHERAAPPSRFTNYE